MIYDRMDSKEITLPEGKKYQKAFAFLRQCLQNPPAMGRYEIDGETIYANVMEYETKLPDEAPGEAHHQYADLQLVLTGNEEVFCGFTQELTFFKDVPQNDTTLYSGVMRPCRLDNQHFLLLMPADVHRPGYTLDKPAIVHKVVVKILL